MTGVELEDRLIKFAVNAIILVKKLSKVEKNLSQQLYRSSTSIALNYGEARAGQSKKDFVHKMQIVLKELRETSVCLRIIREAKLISDSEELSSLEAETEELTRIFVASIKTAKSSS